MMYTKKEMRLRDEYMDEKSFDDSHDIEKHLLSVHAIGLRKFLSDDLVLAMLDDKERKYVSEQLSLAHEATYLIKEKYNKDYAVSRLLLKAFSVAILARNMKGNFLPETLLKKQEEIMRMQPPDMDKAIVDKANIDTRGRKV